MTQAEIDELLRLMNQEAEERRKKEAEEVFEEREESHTTICRTCNGTGRDDDIGHNEVRMGGPCPDCNGTGEESEDD